MGVPYEFSFCRASGPDSPWHRVLTTSSARSHLSTHLSKHNLIRTPSPWKYAYFFFEDVGDLPTSKQAAAFRFASWQFLSQYLVFITLLWQRTHKQREDIDDLVERAATLCYGISSVFFDEDTRNAVEESVHKAFLYSTVIDGSGLGCPFTRSTVPSMPALTSPSRASTRYPLRSRRPAQQKKTGKPPAPSHTASSAAHPRQSKSKKQKVKHTGVSLASSFRRERKVRFVEDNRSEDEERSMDAETPEPAARPLYSLPPPALLPNLPPSPPLQLLPHSRADGIEYPLRYIPYKSPPQVYLPRLADTLPLCFHLTSPVDPGFFRSIAPSPQPCCREEDRHLSLEVPPFPPPFTSAAIFDSFSLPPPPPCPPPPSGSKPSLEQLDLHSLLDLVESTIPGTSPSPLSYLSSSSFLDLAPPSLSALYPSQPPSASMSDFSLPTTPFSATSAASSTLTFSSSPFATEQAQGLISPDGRAELSPLAKEVDDEEKCVEVLRAMGYGFASAW
ncbi:hypothetical protein JCM8547_002195 [Rhodosporidiobolus lusitaniae]